jgi:ADP-heptose:LPS heptosyltransferase
MTQNQPQHSTSGQQSTFRVLAINFGGIGDEILFLPTLQSIRKAYPDASLTLLLEPRSRSFEQITNLIDSTIVFDIKKRPLLPSDLWQLLSLIREGRYDVVVSSGGSPQVAALLFLSAIKKRVGYGSNPLAKLLLTDPIPLNKNQYAAGMYQDLAQGIGQAKMPPAQCLPVAFLKKDSLERMGDFLHTTDSTKRLVVIHPGTSRLAVQKGIIKTWETDNWVNLISRLQAHKDIQVILAGGPDDEETIADLLKKAPAASSGGDLLSAVGKTKSLADLAALISLSDLLVCVDSAPMHLAVALDKPLVALFGPTDEAKLLPMTDTLSPGADNQATGMLSPRADNQATGMLSPRADMQATGTASPEAGATSQSKKARAKFKGLRDVPISEFPRQLGDGLGVRLQPDIVYQCVLDQLKEWTTPKSHPPQKN